MRARGRSLRINAKKFRALCRRRAWGHARAPPSALHSLDEGNRSIGLAESPRSKREIDHRRDARIRREANCQIVVASGLKQGERTFELAHGLNNIHRRNSGSWPGPDGRRRPRASQVSPRRRARRPPHAFSSRGVRLACSCRPTGRNRPPGARARPCAKRGFACSRERFRRFRRAIAAGRDERGAVIRSQLRHSPPLRQVGPDLIDVLKRRQQRLRLGNLGHFRRWREAFERRREDGVGVGGTAGRSI